MKVWATHAVFAAILVGSLVARERAAETAISTTTFELAVVHVARGHGLRLREHRANSTQIELRTLAFDSPYCTEPILVIVRPVTFEDEAVINSASAQDYSRQYVYMDWKSDTPRRWALVALRTKYSLLSMLGVTQYYRYANVFILQVDSPRDCRVAETINWSKAWRREEFYATGTSRLPAS